MRKTQNPYQQRMNENGRNNSEKGKKKDQKKNPNKININVAQCQYSIVRTVAKKLKWNILNDPVSNLNFDIVWIDGHARQQIFARMQPFQKINHFPGMEILSRKNFLGKSLMEFKKNFPEEYDFFPLTWNLPTQYVDLKDYHDNRQQGKAQTFIVKPENGCQGKGIFLTRNIDKLKYDKCVVQRYLHKPFLIDELKFDLRIYVLVAGIDPLRIFVFEQGLARFCTEKYQAPKSDNLDNKFMHLTNYAINKLSPDFIFNQDAKQTDSGHKRSLSSIYKKLAELGHDSEVIKGRINDMIIKTIITGYPTLSRMQQGCHPQNFANDMCFEILGFDVFLNHKLHPYIIEINYTPSFSVDTPFDKQVKKNLIYDTLKIMNISEKWKKEVRKKRQLQIRERMLSGKRVKYSQEQRLELTQKYALLRDQHEAEHLGGFRKVFCQSQEQMLKYAHYYEFAQTLYQKENKITGVTTSKGYTPFYMAYSSNSTKTPSNKQFIKSTAAFGTSVYKTGGLRPPLIKNQTASRVKSIQNRRIISAKNIQSRTPPLNFKAVNKRQSQVSSSIMNISNNNLPDKKAIDKKLSMNQRPINIKQTLENLQDECLLKKTSPLASTSKNPIKKIEKIERTKTHDGNQTAENKNDQSFSNDCCLNLVQGSGHNQQEKEDRVQLPTCSLKNIVLTDSLQKYDHEEKKAQSAKIVCQMQKS